MQHKALKSLKDDTNIVSVAADKGKATVVMDKEDYSRRMMTALDEGKYSTLKQDPTVKVENSITNTLKRLHNEGHIDDKLCDFLTPRYSSPPQMYGLPKVHKEGIAMRPIVWTIGSPTYRLAKELARIRTPLVGNSGHSVKNSKTSVDRIRDMETLPQDLLVSFDVASLFTQVPVDDALRVEAKLCVDETLPERTSIPSAHLIELVELCLGSTHFNLHFGLDI